MLPSVIQTSKRIGMQNFCDELTRLALTKQITPEEAYIKAVDKAEMDAKFRLSGIEYKKDY